MQSNNPSESKKICDAHILAEILRQSTLSLEKDGGISIDEAFAQVRQQAERMKVLYADLFNNNRKRREERSR